MNGERKWRSYSSSVTWSWRSWISEASWQWWWNSVGRILVKASRHLSLDLKTLLRQFQRSDKKLTWDCAHQDSEHDGVHKTSNHKSEKLQKQVINNNGVSNQRTTAESWFNLDDADISLCEEWEVKSFPQVSPNTAPFVRRKEVDVDCSSRLSQATKIPIKDLQLLEVNTEFGSVIEIFVEVANSLDLWRRYLSFIKKIGSRVMFNIGGVIQSLTCDGETPFPT